MKTKLARRTNLFEGGKESLEDTNEFKRKVREINTEIKNKYSLTLLNEKGWRKRLVIVIDVRLKYEEGLRS